jgi:hypothetical protein
MDTRQSTDSRRYVVIDACVLFSDLHNYVSGSDQCVLSHAIVSDIVGSERFSKHKKDFARWLCKHAGSVWVAREWVELKEEEDRGSDCSQRFCWRDDYGTSLLRRSIVDPGCNMEQQLEQLAGSEVIEQFENGRSAFLELVRDFENFLRTEQHEVVRELFSTAGKKQAQSLIQEPLLGGVFPRKLDVRYSSDEWQRQLNIFPDVKTFGRVSRILCWYGQSLLRQTGRRGLDELPKKFGNNYEDFQYGLSASYTGYLATKDRGLREMVEAVFPHVEVLEPSVSDKRG